VSETVHGQLVNILEAALFAADKALTIEQMQNLFDEEIRPGKAEIKQALQHLQNLYQDRGVNLHELATGYRFQTQASLSPWVQRLWEEKPPRLSRAVLETLALMAYRQPITRGEIEEVRGVAVSSQIVRTLMEREWIRVVGHKEVPGRPALYATTNEFLSYFNLRSLDELPTLAELQSMLLEEADVKATNEKQVAENEEFQEQSQAFPDIIEDDIETLADIDMADVDSVLDNFEQRMKEANAKADDEENTNTSLPESV